MFDFLDSDWFIITLEIVFLVFIIYDLKKYFETKKKEYITNAVLTVGFAIWALSPMYTKYIGWENSQKEAMDKECVGDANVTEICHCVNDTTFKAFTYSEFNGMDKNSTAYVEFMREAKDDCSDDSWF